MPEIQTVGSAAARTPQGCSRKAQGASPGMSGMRIGSALKGRSRSDPTRTLRRHQDWCVRCRVVFHRSPAPPLQGWRSPSVVSQGLRPGLSCVAPRGLPLSEPQLAIPWLVRAATILRMRMESNSWLLQEDMGDSGGTDLSVPAGSGGDVERCEDL